MFNIFILGAGFSKRAGVPLGAELFKEVLSEAKSVNLYENILRPDIERYLEYYNKLNKGSITENEINFEEFISYLDIENFLKLKGKNTWSDKGERSQIAIRNLIAKIIYQRTSSINQGDLSIYETFVKKLKPRDIIITFNYDTIIEKCLEKQGMPYRLFLDRLSSVGNNMGIGDNSDRAEGEIILLKMHGSIDWFNIEEYDKQYNYFKKDKYFQLPQHIIFSDPLKFDLTKIIDGPYFEDSLLNRIYRVRKDLYTYFLSNSFVFEQPLILVPSFNKIVYINPLKEFWYSFYAAGVYNQTVAIIGFSLPGHDDYMKQGICTLIDNFQNDHSGEPLLKKTKLKIVDYRKNEQDIQEFKNKYSFVNWNNTDCYFNGFDEKAIEMIFE